MILGRIPCGFTEGISGEIPGRIFVGILEVVAGGIPGRSPKKFLKEIWEKSLEKLLEEFFDKSLENFIITPEWIPGRIPGEFYWKISRVFHKGHPGWNLE